MDFLSFYWRDVLDIALVTLLLYRILLLIRGTRAFSALIGLVVLVAVYALSHFIGLYSLSWLLENLFGSLFLVIVILFHDDIRQALAAMGTQYLSWKKRPAPSNMVGDLVWVCQYFAKRRIGALIVLEGKVQLGDMMKAFKRTRSAVRRKIFARQIASASPIKVTRPFSTSVTS